MSNLPNKCPKCGLPYCNPVGGRGACWEIDGNGCLERQLAAAVKERNEARDLVWVILAMTGANDDEIAETIKCSKPVTSAIRDASLVSAAEDIARRVAAEAERDALKAKVEAVATYGRECAEAARTTLPMSPGERDVFLQVSEGLDAILNDAREGGEG